MGRKQTFIKADVNFIQKETIQKSAMQRTKKRYQTMLFCKHKKAIPQTTISNL